MRRRIPISILVVMMGLFGCGHDSKQPGAQATPARGSQLLITIDAAAARHLAPFGGPRAMPALAGIAASGTIYDDALSTTPVARPALVTILAGVAPDRSGVRDNIHDGLPDSTPVIAEGARKKGFETAAFVSTAFASYSSGLHRGFDLFDGPEEAIIGPGQHRPPVVPAATLADHFKQWLGSRDRTKPFFAWIHLADLNGLATPPPGSAGSSVTKSGDPLEDYDKTLGSLDEALGAIVSAAKGDPAAKDCTLVIVGTHGAYLGEGGRRGDAFWLSDETLRIPLIQVGRLSDPSAASPRHDARPSWLPDVAATLWKAIGTARPKDADGIPLDEAAPANRVRLAWTYAPDDRLAWAPLTAVKDGDKLSVFSASHDGKLHPSGEVSPGAAEAAASRPALPRPRILSDAVRRAATAAGVKLGPGGTVLTPPPDADAWLRDLEVDIGFMANKRFLLAARQAKRLLGAAPDAYAVLLIRLSILSAAPSEELSEIRDKLLALFPDRSDALHWSAHVSLLTKDYVKAGALLDAALAVGPVEPEMYYDRACVYALRGEVQPGLNMLKRALESGYRNWEWMDRDPDLSAIRARPEFMELLRAHGR